MKDRTNRRFWQRVAKLYAPLCESDRDFYPKLSAFVQPYLNGDMEVLELACGSGQLSFPLSGCVRSWLATDFSENMIAEARKRGETDRLRFRVADATALPFPDAHYDCAVIANALHIMPEPEQALREISRVLKPGGLLYAPTFLWAEEQASEVRRRLMELAGFKAYREWNLAQFRAFIEAQGYTVLKQELLESVPAPVGMLLARKQAQA